MSQFFYTSGRHVPDMMLKGGALFRIVSDDLGSVRVVVKMGDGGQWQRLDYDEWGRPTNNTSPNFQPFGYAGGLCYDPTRCSTTSERANTIPTSVSGFSPIRAASLED